MITLISLALNWFSALAIPPSSNSETFDASKEIECVTSIDGYPEAQKLTLSPANRRGIRDLDVVPLGHFPNACEANGLTIECTFASSGILGRSYSLSIDLQSLGRSPLADGQTLGANALLTKSWASSSAAICRQAI